MQHYTQISVQRYTILEYGQFFLYLNNGGILGTDLLAIIRLKLMALYSSFVRHQIAG